MRKGKITTNRIALLGDDGYEYLLISEAEYKNNGTHSKVSTEVESHSEESVEWKE